MLSELQGFGESSERGRTLHHVLFKDVSRSDLGWVVCWMDVFLMLMAVIHA